MTKSDITDCQGADVEVADIELCVEADTLEAATVLEGDLKELPGVLEHGRVTQQLGNEVYDDDDEDADDDNDDDDNEDEDDLDEDDNDLDDDGDGDDKRLLTTIMPGLKASSRTSSHSCEIRSRQE